MRALLLALLLCSVAFAAPCSLGANAVVRQIVAHNGEAAGTLRYLWTGNSLSFCVIANTYFCVEESTVWVSSTNTFSAAPTVTNYGCTSDSQTTITTAPGASFFRIQFSIKKFTNNFPVGVEAASYRVWAPSGWHNTATQLSKSYHGTQTQFVTGGPVISNFGNCVDYYGPINQQGNVAYTPKFYHYLDPNVPDVYKANFYKINYLINADIKEQFASVFPSGWSFMDIQYAIWDMVHPNQGFLGNSAQNYFRNYANSAPANWKAGPGDYDTLIAFESGIQDTMIHVRT